MERIRIPEWILVVALVGLTGARGAAWGQAAPAGKAASAAAVQHLICGVVHKLDGAKFALETRSGKTVQVDASAAVRAERSVTLYEGIAISASGTLDKGGALHAEMVNRIKSARATWPEDR